MEYEECDIQVNDKYIENCMFFVSGPYALWNDYLGLTNYKPQTMDYTLPV